MAISIRNASTAAALNDINKASRKTTRAMEKLSSGSRIARAADDAAGLAVADRLRADWKSVDAAGRNANNGISMITVADGAASEISNVLVRMRELATQSASETTTTAGRTALQTEFASLKTQIDDISGSAEFGGTSLLSTDTTINVQVGKDSGDSIAILLKASAASDLGLTAASVSTATGAGTAMGLIDSALDELNSTRAGFGAAESALDSALNFNETYSAALQGAESNIRDADFGKETAELSTNQVLQQAGISVLRQSNQMSSNVLDLLG